MKKPWTPAGLADSIRLPRSAQMRISSLIDHDPLTGLANRRLFMRHLKVQLQRGMEESRRTTVLHIDLDHFDRINSALGGTAGDEILRTVSVRLASCLAAGDELARLEGDTFVVSLGCSVSGSTEIASRVKVLLAAIAAPVSAGGQDVFVTASIGVASAENGQTDVEVLMCNARMALKRAKEAGRNVHAVYSAAHLRTDPDRFAIEAGLRSAIDRAAFHLLYQPHVDLNSGEIVAVEALLRWNHPVLGLVEPDRFIPIAEELGLMGAIDQWVLDAACETAARWQAARLQPVRMSVNVSGRELGAPDFADRLATVLDRHALDPARFAIEITERRLASHMDEAAAQLESLRAMQIGIALDDFGTGQSSLTCLRRLPIDVVKIDRSLIREITSSAEALALTRAIIAMAHGLGIKTLAEGVESAGQLELLAANGCDSFQGYYFSAPVAEDEIGLMLRAGRKLRLAERRLGSGVRTIVIIDNEQWAQDKLRQHIGWRLRDSVRVETFGDAATGLQRLRQGPVSVVICALRMPGTDGIETLAQARCLQPKASRMMLIGPTDMARVMTDDRQIDVFRYLSKPWLLEQLLDHVEAAIHQSDLAHAQQIESDASQLVRYSRGLRDVPAPGQAPARRGLGVVDRGPFGEVLMPQAVMTLPGDLWAMGRSPTP